MNRVEECQKAVAARHRSQSARASRVLRNGF